MKTKKIVIVANKSWEADPLINVLLHEKVRNKEYFQNFKFPGYPRLLNLISKPDPDLNATPRITFDCIFPNIISNIEVWCLQDLMNQAVSSSSTVEKWRVLPKIFKDKKEPDLVIAFGTAGIFNLGNRNGSVVVGSKVFIHNPYEGSSDDPPPQIWSDKRLNTLISSPKSIDFRKIPNDFRFKAESRFFLSTIEPSIPPVIMIGHGFNSLGIVNVLNYDHYFWADKRAIEAFRKAGHKGVIGSIESTHGLIRLQTESPFLFVSGIVDEDGKFDAQVTPKEYSQNFVGAHNAGLVLCYLLEAVTIQMSTN